MEFPDCTFMFCLQTKYENDTNVMDLPIVLSETATAIKYNIIFDNIHSLVTE